MKLRCILLFLVPFISFTQAPMPLVDCPDQPYRIASNFNEERWTKQNYPIYFGITDSAGNELLPFLYDQIFPMRRMADTCGNTNGQFIVTEGAYQFIFDAKTNRKSTPHSYILYTGEQYLFQDSACWGMLDSSFNTVISGVPGTPASSSSIDYFYEFSMEYAVNFYSYFLYEDIAFQKEYVVTENLLTTFPEVLLYKKDTDRNQSVETYWDPSISYKDYSFGLFHMQNKRLIPPVYHDIRYRYADKQLYYWCTQFKKYNLPLSTHSYQGELHIYDQSLNLINKIPFLTNPPENFDLTLDQFARFTSSNPKIYPLENKRHRFGAIDAKGTTVLPFQYDSITIPVSPWRITLLKAAKNHHVQLLDDKGNEFVAGTYEDIRIADTRYEIWIFAKTTPSNDSWHIISPKGNMSADGFEKLFYDQALIYRLGIPYEYRMNDRPVFCGILHDQLYLISNNQRYLCDSTRFNFKQETFWINQFVVNKTGNIIYQGNSLHEINTFGYLDRNSGCTTILSPDCSKKLEVDLPLVESDWNNGLICLQKADGDFATFDMKHWVWLKGE